MEFGVVLGMRKKAGKELLSCRMGLKRYSIWIDHVWNLYCLTCGWLFLFYVLLWLFWRMDEDLCRVWGEEDGRSEMIDVLCVGGEILNYQFWGVNCLICDVSINVWIMYLPFLFMQAPLQQRISMKRGTCWEVKSLKSCKLKGWEWGSTRESGVGGDENRWKFDINFWSWFQWSG